MKGCYSTVSCVSRIVFQYIYAVLIKSSRLLPCSGSAFISAIVQKGFDERHAYIGGMFGAGKSAGQGVRGLLRA